MAEQLRTAVIGVGNMGANHARVYSEMDNSRLVAVADPNTELGQKVADRYGVKYYPNYWELLAGEKLDAVSVVVPTKAHREVVVACLDAHVPTLVEKPIADTPDNAELMIKAMHDNRTFMMVGHIERFNPAVTNLKRMIDEGQLGTIINLMARRVGPIPPKVPGSDVALDLAIHDIDVINMLLGQFPIESIVRRQKVYRESIADAASILLTYKGATADIHTNWLTEGDKVRMLYVTGTKGTAELDYIARSIKVFHSQKRLRPDGTGNFLEFVSLSDRPVTESHTYGTEPLVAELKYFLDRARARGVGETRMIKSAVAALNVLVNKENNRP